MRHRLWLVATGCLLVAIAGRTTGASPSPSARAAQSPVAQKAPPAVPTGYVGSDTCMACHSDKWDTLKGTPHANANNPRSPQAAHGCESCHGPGQAHVDDDAKGHIRKFGQITAGEMNETCLTCHNRGAHAGWEASAHEQRGLSCGTCHSVHSPTSAEHQLVKATQTQVCATCHRLQVTKTERAVAHMPVREGKMTCTSCHNPHGTVTPALLKENSLNDTCYTCHAGAEFPMKTLTPAIYSRPSVTKVFRAKIMRWRRNWCWACCAGRGNWIF